MIVRVSNCLGLGFGVERFRIGLKVLGFSGGIFLSWALRFG